MKQVRQFVGTASYGDHCVLATRLDDEEIHASTQCDFGLILCNALGTPVDSKYVSLEPRLVAMTSSHVITASDKSFILWHYRTPRSQTTLDIAGTVIISYWTCKKYSNSSIFENYNNCATGLKRENKEKVYNIDTFLTGDHTITSITARDNVLIFGTQSNYLVGFNLSSSTAQFVGDIQLDFVPTKMTLNSNSTYVMKYFCKFMPY